MIDGITILSESVYRGCDSKLGLGFAIASLFFAIVAIKIFETDDYGVHLGIFLAFVFLFVISVAISCMSYRQAMYEAPEYKVTISDDVGFNEFNKKYEVVEQEGEIYTIRERRAGEDK